jgi:ankyrin repeat protein
MSETLPDSVDLRQLRTQAKELLASLQTSEPEATRLSLVYDPQLKWSTAKLADAQRLLARKYGFPSWPQLVAKVETPLLLDLLRQVLEAGDPEKLESLLKRKPSLKKHLNEPLLNFDAPPVVGVSRQWNAAKLIPILVKYGADPNVRSSWWAGGYSALDGANEETVQVLLDAGAKFDVWSAAAHGRVSVLEELLDQDPSLVNAPGGDGERPLHFASNPEVAELLVARGGDLEIRDVDHESTPIQYQISNPDVLKVLLKHGAKGDIFTAVAVDDLDLLDRILKADPDSASAMVGRAPFITVQSTGGHIYVYKLGSGMTPQQLAVERGSKEIIDRLDAASDPKRRFLAAAWSGNRSKVNAILQEHPDLVGSGRQEISHVVAWAAQAGRTEAVKILLEAGLDPLAEGMDSGTALHVAAWFGWPEVVTLLVGQVPIELGDRNHDSPPLGWALHGSQHCRNPKGDYVAVVKTLIAAGADPNSEQIRRGKSVLKQIGIPDKVKEALIEGGCL